ncbi:MAG: DUF4367 domain-containing protein [Lachnospiraceae bacterium]|nr:DUF4367 domain-containing protein [Lachnospiraceae bacterium]MBR6152028.1 DUF4367 domain-containing protein [Lachnospiraceae bacterium]
MNRKSKNSKEEIIISDLISDLHEKELEEIYSKIVVDEIEFSEQFHEKMRFLESKLHRKNYRKTVLRVAIGAMACMTIVILLAFPGYVVNASRYAIEWFQGHVGMQFIANPKEMEAVGYHLSYVPDGYALRESDIGEKNGYYIFSNDGNEEICFYYVNNNAALTMDYDDSLFNVATMEDGRMLYISKSENDIDGASMVWQSQDGSTEFSVNCDVAFSDEELLKIASSVEFVGKE